MQANPLNTYLSNKPSFTSPQPLAAASGLTIPIQITLSEIKLSAFIILVFSRQKGVTLVFRNDPLESLKVSSTFDAIPFVRDYLQREIERQLRTLLMDELPLIIHRLSLRLFVPEYREQEGEVDSKKAQDSIAEEKAVDPLASPPQDPVDISGNTIDPSHIASLSLDSGSETQALFSQKNLLRLGALKASHETLSLFTPSIRDVVFRAWAGPTERSELCNTSGKGTPASAISLTRQNTFTGVLNTPYASSDGTDRISQAVKSLQSSLASSTSGSNLVNVRHGKSHGRKRKHRVVNLRKKKTDAGDDLESVSGDSTTNSATVSSATSDEIAAFQRPRTPERGEGELSTPPFSPEHALKEPGNADFGMTPPQYQDIKPRHSVLLQRNNSDIDQTPRQSHYYGQASALPASRSIQYMQDTTAATPDNALAPTKTDSTRTAFRQQHPLAKSSLPSPSPEVRPQSSLSPSPFDDSAPNYLHSQTGSAEKPKTTASSSEPATASVSSSEASNAWMTKMAATIAQKAQDQKKGGEGLSWNAGLLDQKQPQQRRRPPLPSSENKYGRHHRRQDSEGRELDRGESPPPAYAL